jgi:hypothetical protein
MHISCYVDVLKITKYLDPGNSKYGSRFEEYVSEKGIGVEIKTLDDLDQIHVNDDFNWSKFYGL